MVKVISLSNEAYEKLKALKRGKSFSEVVVKLVGERKKKNIMDFAGIFSDNADYWDEAKKRIYNARKRFKLRAYKI